MPPRDDHAANSTGEGFEIVLKEARAGSREALTLLLEDRRPDLLRLARGLRVRFGCIVEECDPEDLVQDAFARALERFPRFRGSSKGEWDAWLRAIVLNLARHKARGTLRQLRRGRPVRRPTGLERIPSPGPADDGDPGTVVTEADRASLRRWLGDLPVRTRVSIVLRFALGWSFDSIACRLGCSQAAVRKHLARLLIGSTPTGNRDTPRSRQELRPLPPAAGGSFARNSRCGGLSLGY
ncbi:MAG: RNA polymerase sigma factor [Isosphaeraceae bacterium]